MEVGITIKDQYQVVEHIGRGGMADVWSARDQRLNRLVAIKTIAQSLSADDDPIALFEQEAQTIAQMEHPHILPIYDFGDYQNSLYIVMRYVTGGSLEDQLEDDPLTLQEALKISGNIAQALDYAHRNNVIHLDLKPPNILMDSGGSPYLADFGLATVLDKGGTARNPGSGTLLYMAPEQLIAEVIDHRADIYSFCIMIWHMLTGTLPFDGMVPIAMKQLQFQEELPDLAQYNEDIPYRITEILRKGSAVEPKNRPNTLAEIVEELREAADMSTIDLDAAWDMTAGGLGASFNIDSGLTLDIEDVGVLEAADIYIRAKHVWSGGNGRFLLGVSHFMMMCDYYMEADEHHLDLDDAGRQMILRGALEYDYQVDYWWDQVDEEAQRWVCLHTIRSENAPARIRALYRLETLPDDPDSPVIPKLVANALAIETNKDAKLAALIVLGTRAQLMKPSQSYNIKSDYRGKLLSTNTRLGIEILPSNVWKEAVYSPEIDNLIAETALKDDEDDEVAELASRTIGLIHSMTALRAVADAQRQNIPNALRALALIRDEAPYLPDVVTRQARLYAWVANTVRRITDQPMQVVLRFIFALLGGSIGFGQFVYITYRNQALFIPQRWGNTLAVGLLMGLFIAILVLVSQVVISRLRGFWPNWLRLTVSAVTGLLLGTLAWSGYTWLYLTLEPDWALMRMGGAGFAFGLVASALFNMKHWQAFLLTATTIFLAVFTAYFNTCTQIWYCVDATGVQVEGITNFSVAPVAFVGVLVGLMLGVFIPRSKPIKDDDAPPIPPYGLSKFGGLAAFLGLGLALTAFVYSQIFAQTFVNWDSVILLFAIPAILSATAIVALDMPQRLLYGILSVVGFGGMMLIVQNSLTGIDTLIAPGAGADAIDALFMFDQFWQAVAVIIPFSLIIAFGSYAPNLLAEIRQLIGVSEVTKERNAWLTGILIYIFAISALITLFAPFSLHKDVLWAVGWTVISGGTFICTMAAWQWKKWGANGLLIFGVLFIIGAIMADYRDALIMANDGVFPPLFEAHSIVTWGAWVVMTGVMTIGVIRQRLWGAFGLIGMIALWFFVILFVNDVGDSLTTLAILHLPLTAYALRHDWYLFGNVEEKAKAKPEEPVPATAPVSEPTTPVDKPALELETGKFDEKLKPRLIGDSEIATEVVVDKRVINPSDLETQLAPDSEAIDYDSDVDATEKAKSDLSDDADTSDKAEDKPITQSSRKGLKIDTSALKPKPDSGPTRKKLKIDTSALKPKSDSGPTRKKLKIDTSALKPKSDSDQTRKKLKIDTEALKKPDSKSSRKKLKIDTEALKKTDSDSPSKKLKIDTGLLKSKSDTEPSRSNIDVDLSVAQSRQQKPDTYDDDGSDSVPQGTRDETIPSRPTSKLSTAEIKKQIAEEEQRAQEEADSEAKTEKPKTKFKLDTSRVRKKDTEDDKSDESDE